jgi:hypothetical protein
MCCTIQEATNVYCGTCSDSGFLKNEDNTQRIAKSSIQSYQPIDTLPNYIIEFVLQNGMVVIWTFLTMTARDTALANVDAEMNTQNM